MHTRVGRPLLLRADGLKPPGASVLRPGQHRPPADLQELREEVADCSLYIKCSQRARLRHPRGFRIALEHAGTKCCGAMSDPLQMPLDVIRGRQQCEGCQGQTVHRNATRRKDTLTTCAIAPASAPDSMRCPGVMSSTSSHSMCLMRSLQVSLMAVSGAILITLVPFPRKKALVVPAL